MSTLPERLRELNYTSHLVGKWHLGSAYQNVTPTGRGFDSHYGYWNGYMGYFSHQTGRPGFEGLDMHTDFQPDFQTVGQYATDLFTHRAIKLITTHDYKKPLFLLVSHLAPHTGKYDEKADNTVLEEKSAYEMNRKFSYISDVRRRRYADIVNSVDESVGDIVDALSTRGVLRNTIILFMSDNGGQTFGMHENFASNWPLRGLKFTHFEGGVRGTAVFYSDKLMRKGRMNDNLIHITDLLPTFYKAAGGDPDNLGEIDGINQWETILKEEPTKREELLINIDEVENHVGMLSYQGRYKYINGTIYNNTYDGYHGAIGRGKENPKYNISAVLQSHANVALAHLSFHRLTADGIVKTRKYLQSRDCRQLLPTNLNCSPCLFDLWMDPCETKNIALEQPTILTNSIRRIDQFWKHLVPQQNKAVDPESNPVHYGNVWTTWLDTYL
ncbi:arylsulfatase [Holotrichia oblita]|uniref:Arylsulfatase n=1 Tax=Holotrichia oblita TaxID=644536 RepID=A0ACB9SLR2_HOLOL|nr:arylsulfatase [Holotrichia oblita]